MGLSIYDLVLVADAAVNYRSTAGLEFLQFGIPVVIADPAALYYPLLGSEVGSVSDPAAMDKAIRHALQGGPGIERVRAAFRWYATFLLRTRVPLAEISNFSTMDASPTLRPVRVMPAFVNVRALVEKSPGVVRGLRRLRTTVTTKRRRRRRLRDYGAAVCPPIRDLRGQRVPPSVVDVLSDWRNWLLLPQGTSQEAEDQLLLDAVRKLSLGLGPCDAQEGAVSWIRAASTEPAG